MSSWRRVALAATLNFACVPVLRNPSRDVVRDVPDGYGVRDAASTSSVALGQGALPWEVFFQDEGLRALVALAMKNNQELNISMQELVISQSEILATEGEFLPRVGLEGTVGVEKVGRYTSQGASDATTEYAPGKEVPEHLPVFRFGLRAEWEIDIWKRLRNASKAAALRYLATVEGRSFVMTQIVAEIAKSYYELLAADRQVEVVRQNIEIQENALEVVRVQKRAAKASELAVRRFEAEVLKNRSRLMELRQVVADAEARINFLVGRFPQSVSRAQSAFDDGLPEWVDAGLPADLLRNRPDIRRAELALAAAKVDVEVARARFYPSLAVDAGVGYEAFRASHLLTTPASVFYGAAANLTAPIFNRKGIKAGYIAANARQLKAVYEYERAVLAAVTEVVNGLRSLVNLRAEVELRRRQVDALQRSIEVSNVLYRSARADYMEVLMTRRDALESQMELVESRRRQKVAVVDIYCALGGGWRQQASAH